MSRRGGTPFPVQQARSPQKNKNDRTVSGGGGRLKDLAREALGVKTKQAGVAGRSQLGKRNLGDITPDSSEQTSDTGDDGNDNDSDDDEHEVDEPDEFAPSDPSRKKRGHQTGLSISFSNANIDVAKPARKRAWSNRAHEDDENEMSRPPKAVKPRIKNTIVSDEEDYDGVNLISDEDDEDRLEEEEEKIIIQSEEGNKHENSTISKFQRDSSELWDGFADSGNPVVEDNAFFSEHFARTDPYSSNELYSPNLQASREPEPIPTPTRRVRFADEVGKISPSTQANGSETDHETLPNALAQHNAVFDRDSDSDEEPYWEVGLGEYDQLELDQVTSLGGLIVSEDEGSSSGYETDEGESTDDEVITLATVNRPQAMLRLDSESGRVRPKSTSSAPVRRAPTAQMSNACRQGPAIGSWVADPSKPIAIVDSSGKRMIFYPATRPKKTISQPSAANNIKASPTRPSATLSNSFYESENDRSDASAQAVMVQSPANLMMSGLLGNGADPNPDLASPVVGPPEAFYPFRSFDADGNIMNDDDLTWDFEDEFDEFDINLHDFVNFGDDSDSNDAAASNANATFSDKAPVAALHPTALLGNQPRARNQIYRPASSGHPPALKARHLPQVNEPTSTIRTQKHRHSRSNSIGLGPLRDTYARRIGTVAST